MKQVDGIFIHRFSGKTYPSSPDKEYRKGVHWLETLRLRRTKILDNAYTVRILRL